MCATCGPGCSPVAVRLGGIKLSMSLPPAPTHLSPKTHLAHNLSATPLLGCRYEAYCKCSDFIREHIFPGGHLPCIGVMIEACRGTGLSLHDASDIGPDYAITLREWRQRWEERRDDILRLGYSDRFWRKYRWVCMREGRVRVCS